MTSVCLLTGPVVLTCAPVCPSNTLCFSCREKDALNLLFLLVSMSSAALPKQQLVGF
jgi:hypothetical protein